MRTTIDKYNKLCDMGLIQKSNYDINARVDMILQEVQQMIMKYEEQAKSLYCPNSSIIDKGNSASNIRQGEYTAQK